MKSWEQIRADAVPLLERCWVTLGVPAALEPVEEMTDGIIDPESAILLGMLAGRDTRLWTDIPAWLNRFQDLINFQKLGSMFRSLPEIVRDDLHAQLAGSMFDACPKRFLRIFGRDQNASERIALSMRIKKLLPASEVAKRSIMIHNRLLFGTSFRADLASLLLMKDAGLSGRKASFLLAAANSTVSRIGSDFKDCGYVDVHGRVTSDRPRLPGLFLSTDTARNYIELMQASRFSHQVLWENAVRQLDLRFDSFFLRLLEK